ncbi:helix-turn-helix domain-containing protein [candidate division WS5 bacterium]|uniref:Helix-turn-helix domain-containing protein n=1 Tax=candidate division WS5 bacterium TaxID=2093353 RepID=A0A419DDI9_9BACT|nr:MAG: helix-turn-helix domain-containing protein [candidate division WS5 bacterium]
MEALGKRIKFYRERSGLSQLDLSQRSGVSQASIARIESDKQKNLKRETIEKLAEGLGVSLINLMEPPSRVKEERAPYSSTRLIPVVKIIDIENFKNLKTLIGKSDRYEPSFSPDVSAFYLLMSPELINDPIFNEGDMILIEPATSIKDRDLVFYFSHEKRGIGKIYHRHDSLIILPLGHDMSPLISKKSERKRFHMNIFRIGEIKK